MLYARAVQAGLKGYKALVSPWFGPACRFAPSCSDYAAQALLAHGPLRGAGLAVRRLCRCRPGGGWGYDPVPPAAAKWTCDA